MLKLLKALCYTTSSNVQQFCSYLPLSTCLIPMQCPSFFQNSNHFTIQNSNFNQVTMNNHYHDFVEKVEIAGNLVHHPIASVVSFSFSLNIVNLQYNLVPLYSMQQRVHHEHPVKQGQSWGNQEQWDCLNCLEGCLEDKRKGKSSTVNQQHTNHGAISTYDGCELLQS